ncbi:GntR family transcriptional regulator [Pseudonocardia eucalypti]|uniref:GntR family transcriptional regulator n=1 Tax=Pseudonocardia eucalypti TaxID=648755 RepID=A0ABP9QPI7_9PSEU|nr:DNA-binding GntR family transcriptional regulator [Pseudonocardia eucalypti]
MTSGSTTNPLAALRGYLGTGAVHGRTTEAVTDAMREAILDGVLAPSTWLREDELAGAFEVSRTPVREALRRLADEGLAVKTAHHGTVVAPLSLEDVLALYVVREQLEGLAARLAATRCPDGLVEQLDQIGARMRASTDSTDGTHGGRADQLSKQNLEFHRVLRAAAANTYLDRFLGQVEHAVRRLPVSTLSDPERARQAIEEHDAIVRAIEARDPDAASEAAAQHMRRAREIRLSMLLRG